MRKKGPRPARHRCSRPEMRHPPQRQCNRRRVLLQRKALRGGRGRRWRRRLSSGSPPAQSGPAVRDQSHRRVSRPVPTHMVTSRYLIASSAAVRPSWCSPTAPPINMPRPPPPRGTQPSGVPRQQRAAAQLREAPRQLSGLRGGPQRAGGRGAAALACRKACWSGQHPCTARGRSGSGPKRPNSVTRAS
jgi:hypothetical protein